MASPDDMAEERFCTRPFSLALVNDDGTVRFCPEAWQPANIGSLHAAPLEEVWNSPTAQEIRKAILDGSFSHCKRVGCPRLQTGGFGLVGKSDVQDSYYRKVIDGGLTALPSGPREVFANYGASPAAEGLHARVESGLKDTQVIHISNDCEPLDSAVFLDVLRNFDSSTYPDLKINLVSNGQKFTPKMWASIARSHGAIHGVHINVDAVRPATYAKLHAGARFGALLRNLYFISLLRQRGAVKRFTLGFDVTRHNFKEMKPFISLAMDLGADLVYFEHRQPTPGQVSLEVARNAMLQATHPFHEEFMAELQDPVFLDLRVRMGGLDRYLKRVYRPRAPLYAQGLQRALRGAQRRLVMLGDRLAQVAGMLLRIATRRDAAR